tara:strand:- start:1701 stop:1913 length:213 start_codon:yes stop_codon:yes gene_type:complete
MVPPQEEQPSGVKVRRSTAPQQVQVHETTAASYRLRAWWHVVKLLRSTQAAMPSSYEAKSQTSETAPASA